MNKYILGLIGTLAISNCYAISAAHGSAHASSHASAHESVAVHESIAAHEEVAVRSSYAARQQAVVIASHGAKQIQSNNANIVAAQSDQIPSGVLECEAASASANMISGSSYNGCEMPNGSMWGHDTISIKQFFNRYKPADATKITMVIYEGGKFQIYYV